MHKIELVETHVVVTQSVLPMKTLAKLVLYPKLRPRMVTSLPPVIMSCVGTTAVTTGGSRYEKASAKVATPDRICTLMSRPTPRPGPTRQIKVESAIHVVKLHGVCPTKMVALGFSGVESLDGRENLLPYTANSL